MVNAPVKIGVLSDTHGYLHPRVLNFLKDCDEIWHAGDVGSLEVLDSLSLKGQVRAVYGNIDDHRLRSELPEYEVFELVGVRVLITHIGGYPGKYTAGVRQLIAVHRPGIVVCGHSHILKVMHDPMNNLLFMNPGAAGIHGFHQKITALRFIIQDAKPKDLELFETAREASRP